MAAKEPPTNRVLGPLGQPIGYLLMRAHHAFRAVLDETLRPQGFSMPQVAVMLALGRNPGLSIADLARKAFVTPQAMGEVLAALEAKGCVVRRAHDSHGRILPAELTPAGMEARRTCKAILSEAEASMLSKLSVEERRLFGELLERCLAGLHDRATAASNDTERASGSVAVTQVRPRRLQT